MLRRGDWGVCDFCRVPFELKTAHQRWCNWRCKKLDRARGKTPRGQQDLAAHPWVIAYLEGHQPQIIAHIYGVPREQRSRIYDLIQRARVAGVVPRRADLALLRKSLKAAKLAAAEAAEAARIMRRRKLVRDALAAGEPVPTQTRYPLRAS